MAIITDVRFSHQRGGLADTLAALPDVEITVVRETSTDPKNSRYVIRFAGDAANVQAVLDADPTVRDATPMPGGESRQLWGVEFAPEAKLLNPEVTSENGFVLDARSSRVGDASRRGWYERWLLPDREALSDVWEYAREEGYDFEILDLRQQGRVDPEAPDPDALTAEQREALVAAYESGYFAEPREISLEELAESLGLSATAVGGRIRRGMKALIGMTLVVDGRADERCSRRDPGPDHGSADARKR